MTMWGQPPSAVQASKARLGFFATIPTLKLGLNLSTSADSFLLQLPLDFQKRSFAPRTAEGGCPHIQPLCHRLFIVDSFRIFNATTGNILSHSAPSTDGFFLSVCARLCLNAVCMTTELNLICVSLS